jgi:hypothetical protein
VTLCKIPPGTLSRGDDGKKALIAIEDTNVICQQFESPDPLFVQVIALHLSMNSFLSLLTRKAAQ